MIAAHSLGDQGIIVSYLAGIEVAHMIRKRQFGQTELFGVMLFVALTE